MGMTHFAILLLTAGINHVLYTNSSCFSYIQELFGKKKKDSNWSKQLPHPLSEDVISHLWCGDFNLRLVK